ncbi:glycogen synthase GlgA [Pseudooceanicola sediminis]|nr:glycogen synthase GlgA [Pseudooceanicola sediminis]
MTSTSEASGMRRVLSVTSECVPLIKTGGLADVSGALPGALAAHGWDMRVLLPAYPGVAKKVGKTRVVWQSSDLFGGPASVRIGRSGRMSVLLLDAPHLFSRDGGPYLDPQGRDYPDNPERFAALCWVAMEIARDGLTDGWRPELVHAHDWQGALVPLYLRQHGVRVPSLLTIHNIAFQGLTQPERLSRLRIDPEAFEQGHLEFWGKVGVLKAGMMCADRVSTVSPRYAAELSLPEFGMGLDGVIAALNRPVVGILNGIDLEVWNPETDPAITPFSAARPASRSKNRKALLDRFGLEDGPGPLAAVVSRMTEQKGLDLLAEVLPGYIDAGGRLVVLGSGDPEIEKAFHDAAARWPAQVGMARGYDEPLSHLMYAGADAMLVPSRFEPCGLTQLYGLRYGAVPLVAPTGGLADTVIAANPAALGAGVATGIMMSRIDAGGLYDALMQLCTLHAAPTTFKQIQKNGMRADFGWERSAAAYASLFSDIITEATE